LFVCEHCFCVFICFEINVDNNLIDSIIINQFYLQSYSEERKSGNYCRNTFARTLKERKSFVIKLIEEDGAGLFRAMSVPVFDDDQMHVLVYSCSYSR